MRFGFLLKRGKPEAREIAAELGRLLRDAGCGLVALAEDADALPGARAVTPEELGGAIDALVVLGGEIGVRREFRQGLMFAVSYGVSEARFLTSKKLSDLVTLAHAPEKRSVENAPVQLASLKTAFPILSRALTFGSRLSIEGPRYDRYENTGDAAQGKTGSSVIWDIVFSGQEPRYGVGYAFGVYNAFDWHYSVPVSNEFKQRSIAQNGRTFLASLDAHF